MESRNPVFNRSDAFSRRGYATFNEAPPASAGQLEDMYSAPAATGLQTGRMTMDDVVIKTGLMFAVLVPLAAVNFFLKNPVLTFGGAIAGLVIALVISFKQSTNPALMLTYAGLEGLFVGGISGVYEDFYDGIVAQAVLGTLAVFSVALWAYKSGRVRATPKFQRGVMIALGGYLVFSLVNLGVVLFTDNNLRGGWLGIGIGLIAITIAAAMLILDFDFAEQGVKNGLPERYSWLAAFGLVVTLVWLYIEFLRLISILRGSD
ncbi:MAG TPA: Bax inhibitor-1/YccA family protein [Actinomycetes bacterium]